MPDRRLRRAALASRPIRCASARARPNGMPPARAGGSGPPGLAVSGQSDATGVRGPVWAGSRNAIPLSHRAGRGPHGPAIRAHQCLHACQGLRACSGRNACASLTHSRGPNQYSHGNTRNHAEIIIGHRVGIGAVPCDSVGDGCREAVDCSRAAVPARWRRRRSRRGPPPPKRSTAWSARTTGSPGSKKRSG